MYIFSRYIQIYRFIKYIIDYLIYRYILTYQNISNYNKISIQNQSKTCIEQFSKKYPKSTQNGGQHGGQNLTFGEKSR